MRRRLRLQLLQGKYAICRLPPYASAPSWIDGEGFVAINRSDDALTVLCPSERVPEDTESDHDWVCLKLIGPFDLHETGIALSVVQPLSDGGIGVFLVSGFDCAHLLIKDVDLLHAQMLLQNAGHCVD